MRADAAHQPLGAGENDGGGNQKRRDAHVVEPRHGTGGVVTVHGAQHLVAGERGFDGDLGGFGVADFPDHDDVRILPQNGAQGVGEAEADFFFDRHLVDAGDLKFDGVFDRDDVEDRIVQLVERGVQRGGFAGAGRAGDEDQSVRRVHGGLHLLEGVGIQSQLFHARGKVALVEHAQHDFFAMHRGHDGNAQIKILAGHLDAHAAVLRQPALGDVEAGHDFEARGQRQLHLLGRRGGVHEHAVHAVTQAHAFFKRLNVDVARPVLDGLHQN